jgi:tetratricopeptide (TPR) repeat protein/TolB-like protein/tRNA A-37 threonylcarbamoyl transferase component Bud32
MADPKSSLPPDEVTPYTPPDEGETLDGEVSSSTNTAGKVTPGSSFAKGQVLAGRFRVVRFVARGGMGEVYEAEDLELNERVALKTVRFEMAENEHTIERFKREIQLARKVTHPGVCRTFDVFRHIEPASEGVVRETLIVSMEFLRGTTLSQRIALSGRLKPAFALPIVEQVAAGLEAAHAAGVIHRDFKSPNVLLVPATGSPNGIRVVITDFGLAHAVSGEMASLTGSLDVVGTPAYMAPEQLEGKEITAATDTYALGIVMFEMLTGAVPFTGSTVISSALRRLKEPAPSPKSLVQDLDPLWEAVVLRCLEREPQRRFASTIDVAKALRGDAVPTPAPLPGTARRKFYLPAAVLALLIFAAVISYVAIKKATTTAPANTTTAAPAPANKSRTAVAILGFQNLSGQPNTGLLADVLTDSLWPQLDVEEIRFIPPGRVDEMRRDLGITEIKEDPDKEQTQRIGKYLGCDVLVTGSYRVMPGKDAQKVDWNIHLLRTSDNVSLASFQASGVDSEINKLATREGELIRSKLGIELSAQEESRLDSSFSANPDALRSFAEAREKLRDFDLPGAVKLLQKAIAADPKFIQAHEALAGAWSDLGFDARAQESAKQALDLSGAMSVEGKGLVTGRYYETLHDWPKATEQYASLWTVYKDNPEYGLLLANSQTNGGKAAQALTTLKDVMSLPLSQHMAARADLQEAEAQEGVSNFTQQLAAATSASEKAKSLNAKLLLARARIIQCAALLNAGETLQAKPMCDEARQIAQSFGDALGTARATNEVANAYWRQGDFATAKPLYEQALGTAQTIGDRRDEAGALNNLANIRHAQGDAVGAVRDYQRSIAIANERGSLGDQALSQQMLGVIYYEQGKTKEGEAAFQQAILTARRIGDRNTESRALINRCSARLNVGELKSARRDCEQSLQIRRAMDDQSAIAGALGATGDVDHAEGDSQEAERNYTEALRIQEQLGQKPDAATSRVFLAMLALENGKQKEAQAFAQDAVVEFANEKDGASESAARAMLAEALLAQGNVSGSQSELATAKHLSEASGDRSLRSRIALVQAKIDLQSGNPGAAIRALREIEKESRRNGEIADALEAGVTLGEAQLKAGHVTEAQSTLASVAQEAKSKGFGRLASKAKLALVGKAPS